MKYIVNFYKGQNIIINQDEYSFIGQAKLEKKDSIFLRSNYIAMSNIAKIEPIKGVYQVDERILLSEKTEGKPLSKETFEKTKAEIYSRFKPSAK